LSSHGWARGRARGKYMVMKIIKFEKKGGKITLSPDLFLNFCYEVIVKQKKKCSVYHHL
jgi:hypothetical protein